MPVATRLAVLAVMLVPLLGCETSQSQRLAHRVGALERELARLKEKDEFTLKRLVFVDEMGRKRVVVGTAETGSGDGVGIAVYDTSGVMRIALGVNGENDAAVVNYDKHDTLRIISGTFDDDECGVAVFDADGNLRIRHGIDRRHQAITEFLDGDGEIIEETLVEQ